MSDYPGYKASCTCRYDTVGMDIDCQPHMNLTHPTPTSCGNLSTTQIKKRQHILQWRSVNQILSKITPSRTIWFPPTEKALVMITPASSSHRFDRLINVNAHVMTFSMLFIIHVNEPPHHQQAIRSLKAPDKSGRVFASLDSSLLQNHQMQLASVDHCNTAWSRSRYDQRKCMSTKLFPFIPPIDSRPSLQIDATKALESRRLTGD